MQDNIYKFIINEEANYKTQQVPIVDGWEWNMYEHVRRSTLYKNSKFHKGVNDGMRPFNNIIRPIVNVAYRSEGFDVKDIEPFVDDQENYYKSFLIRKFHPRWARLNNIDTFIDELVESYVDYGLALVKNVNEVRPEVVPLARLAFCDQTDILSGPICEKHQYSIDQLYSQKSVWDSNVIDLAVANSTNEKKSALAEGKAKTPGKYIEVYELHGMFPETWLNKKDTYEEGEEPEYTDSTKYVNQMHIVTYIKQEGSPDQKGVCLYKGKEPKPIYKAIVRDKIYGRACGYGGIEELFEPQVWINYSEIKIKDMLDAAALMILQTANETFKENNKNISELLTGDVLFNDDKPITQVTLQPQNIEKFNSAIDRWEARGRITGSANDPLLGNTPNSGTPFALQELVTVEGKGIHEYRRGKIATFLGEIYRDWTLPYLAEDMNKGQKFIEELSVDELQEIADNIATVYANKKIKEKMLPKNAKDAEAMTSQQQEELRTLLKEQFMKGGQKQFIEVFKDELQSLPIDVQVNIAGKQKNLAKMADGLTNVFRQVISNPQVLTIPGMGKLFNEIIEASGFSPLNFTALTKAQLGEKPVEQPITA